MAEERSIIYQASLDIGVLTQQSAELAKQIEILKAKQKELTASGDQNSVSFQNNATALRQLQVALRQNNKELDNTIRENKEAEGSNNQLRASLSRLTVQYNALSRAEREDAEAGRALQAQIRSISDELKRNESAIGDNRRNVGNYSEGLKSAASSILSNIKGVNGLSSAFSGSGIGTVALLVGTLTKSFSALEPVMDKIEQVTAGVSAAFDVLIHGVGGFFKDLFSGKGIVDSFKDNLSGVTKEMGDQYDAANALQKSIQDLEDVESDFIVTQAKSEATIKNLIIQSKDRTKSEKERIGLLQQANKIDEETLSIQTANAAERLRIDTEQLARAEKYGKDTGELRKKARESEAELIRIQGQSADLQEKNQNRIKQLLEEEAAARDRLLAIFAKDEEMRIRISTSGFTQELKLFDLATKSQIAAARKAGEDVNLVIKVRQKERLALIEQAEKENNEIVLAAQQKLLKDQQDRIEIRLQAQVSGSQEELAVRLEFLNKQRELELSAADLTEAQKLLIENKYRDASEQAEKEHQKRLTSDRILALQNDLTILEVAGMDTIAKRIELATAERDALLKEDMLTVEQRERIELDYQEKLRVIAKQSLDAEQADADSRIEIANQVGNALTGLTNTIAGKSKEAALINKGITIYQLGLDTARSLSQIITLATAPSPDNIATGGLTVPVKIATLSAQVLLNIAKAREVLTSAPGFAEGGLTGTRIMHGHGVPIWRSNGDNILATVRANEVILNERQQAALGGPQVFRQIGVPGFADGGYVNRQVVAEVSTTQGSQEIIRAFKGIRPVVGVDEITRKQTRVSVSEISYVS